MTTTMRFGPEWMRKQPAHAKPLAISPPPSGAPGGNSNGTAPAPPASYSALVTPHNPPVQGKRDLAHPFKYSRDEMLQVYRDLGGCSELPIEVERWEGVVRELAGEPVSLGDFTEVERKLYATSINSENRRRQSSDYTAQGERLKGGTLNSNLGLMSRRRRGDSNGSEHPPLSLPRKAPWSSTSGNLVSPSTASSRTRLGGNNGIDGILNGSDTAWSGGKRRLASGQLVSDRLDEEEETQKDTGHTESKDAVELPAGKSEETGNQPPDKQDPSLTQANALRDSNNDVFKTTVSMNKLSLDTNVPDTQNTAPPKQSNGITTESIGFAQVEWSYIDPTGTIQGPFPGEKMQAWHDLSYFADELLMKRTSIDKDFIPLSEIRRRAQGERIFLSPLLETLPPPGLGHPTSAPSVSSLLQRTGIIDPTRQSSPQFHGRSNTMDSFINGVPGAMASGSPSSSLGGSLARGPLSPDLSAVGSRFQRIASDAALNGRVSAAGSYSSSGSPAMPQAMRQSVIDPSQLNRSSSLDVPGTIPWQTPQNNGIQGWGGSSGVPHVGQPGRFDMAPSFGTSQVMRATSPYAMSSGSGPVDPFFSPSGPSQRFFEQSDALGPVFQQVSRDPSSHFEGGMQQPQLPHLNTAFDHGFEQMASPSASVPNPGSTGNFQHQVQMRQAPPSPWGAPQPREFPRPRPFDADMPTANNTFVVAQHQNTAWNRHQVDAHPQDLWPSIETSGQRQLTEEPQSLTMANVTQHNERQRLLALGTSDGQQPAVTQADAPAPVTVDVRSTVPTITAQSQTPASIREPPAQASAPKGKATATAATVPDSAQLAVVFPPSKTPTAPVTPQKTAWGTDDDGKAKQQAHTNLRDIQEAEKKKQEARKNAGKERERASRVTSNGPPSEDVQFTATWGLPTSQVGTRNNTLPTTKDALATSPVTTPTAPVWSHAAKPAAKTMKEIQEEEERRKLAAKEKETVASAAKKATQIPATKAVAAQPSGGAWTVVGAGGKSQSVASVAASRPAATSQASTPNVQATATRSAAVHRPASSPALAKTTSSTTRVEEEPTAPSLEFMKWMRESLRGLNSSVQFEEIAQMLLSFPLDPDKATKEIIVETVYGASTTLNGRDYAEEFVKRRKEDVIARSGGANGQASNGKPASLADVVKAQPKQPQNDFGAFKVVKKKNKRP